MPCCKCGVFQRKTRTSVRAVSCLQDAARDYGCEGINSEFRVVGLDCHVLFPEHCRIWDFRIPRNTDLLSVLCPSGKALVLVFMQEDRHMPLNVFVGFLF